VLTLPNGLVDVAVTQIDLRETPQLHISVEGQPLYPKVKAAVTSALERLLGLRIDLAAYYQCFARKEQMGHLALDFRGMKPPRFATVFESVINAIVSQHVTRTLGIRLLNRLTVNYGAAVCERHATAHAFPRSEDLAGLCPADLQPLGFSQQKGRAMIELAKSIIEGGLDLEGLAELSDEEAIKRLRRLRGVEPWTTEYVLLRGLGRTNVFPGDVAGARSNVQRWLHLANPPDDAAARRFLDRWHPYGGLIYFHLLLDRLAEAGFLSPGSPQPQNTSIDRSKPRVETGFGFWKRTI
jgi:DNA-3-methyladenine glycosylase II